MKQGNLQPNMCHLHTVGQWLDVVTWTSGNLGLAWRSRCRQVCSLLCWRWPPRMGLPDTPLLALSRGMRGIIVITLALGLVYNACNMEQNCGETSQWWRENWMREWVMNAVIGWQCQASRWLVINVTCKHQIWWSSAWDGVQCNKEQWTWRLFARETN